MENSLPTMLIWNTISTHPSTTNPTRICHTTAAPCTDETERAISEFYPDNLPAVINIGPGSQPGVTFGYGAKFPTKYPKSDVHFGLELGKIYAVHMKPDGSRKLPERRKHLLPRSSPHL
ncbi:MAG: hypothetical protein CM15mP130_0440 [Verrucomicrobiota bacterium]|nr:MAG: hypothetical protein CM15mP130_0440 [Verrucomicrobiota bacterium]